MRRGDEHFNKYDKSEVTDPPLKGRATRGGKKSFT